MSKIHLHLSNNYIKKRIGIFLFLAGSEIMKSNQRQKSTSLFDAIDDHENEAVEHSNISSQKCQSVVCFTLQHFFHKVCCFYI